MLRLQEMDERMAARRRYKAQLALAAETGRSCGKCRHGTVHESGLVSCRYIVKWSKRPSAMPCAFLPEKFEHGSVEVQQTARHEAAEKTPVRIRADWE